MTLHSSRHITPQPFARRLNILHRSLHGIKSSQQIPSSVLWQCLSLTRQNCDISRYNRLPGGWISSTSHTTESQVIWTSTNSVMRSPTRSEPHKTKLLVCWDLGWLSESQSTMPKILECQQSGWKTQPSRQSENFRHKINGALKNRATK